MSEETTKKSTRPPYKAVYQTPLRVAINSEIDRLTQEMLESDAVDPAIISLKRDHLKFCYRIKKICEDRGQY